MEHKLENICETSLEEVDFRSETPNNQTPNRKTTSFLETEDVSIQAETLLKARVRNENVVDLISFDNGTLASTTSPLSMETITNRKIMPKKSNVCQFFVHETHKSQNFALLSFHVQKQTISEAPQPDTDLSIPQKHHTKFRQFHQNYRTAVTDEMPATTKWRRGSERFFPRLKLKFSRSGRVWHSASVRADCFSRGVWLHVLLVATHVTG